MKRFSAFWRSLADSLSGRLALFLAIALLPLGIVAFMQTSTAIDQAQKRSEAALTGEVLRAVAGEARIFQRGQGMARTLASMPMAILDDPAACNALMRRLQQRAPNFSHAGYVRADGRMECTSSGEPRDFSGSETFAARLAKDDFAFSVISNAQMSRTSVVTITHPVTDDTGVRRGLITLSVPHKTLEITARESVEDAFSGLRYITFDAEGEILTSVEKRDAEDLYLPRDRELADLARSRGAFTTVSRGGPLRTYALVEIVPENVYALASWPARIAGQPGFLSDVPPLIFPALMWMASLFVAMFAAELQVARYVRALRQQMKAFAGGDRRLTEPDFALAPVELREVGDAFASMTDTIMHDEARMEDMLHQKEVLLREVHHRVKNNLQLIASIMNMQMRQAHSPESRALMKGLHDRVMSLATIHQGLYQTSGKVDISADELLGDIVRQLMRMGAGPGRRFEVRTEIEPLRLTPDQAVPLALLMTEVVTNALKYATADPGEPLWISVALTRTGPDEARLSVENALARSDAAAAPPGAASGTSGGLGAKLAKAFAQQLGGRLTAGRCADRYAAVLDFALRHEVAEAELAVSEPSGVPEGEP